MRGFLTSFTSFVQYTKKSISNSFVHDAPPLRIRLPDDIQTVVSVSLVMHNLNTYLCSEALPPKQSCIPGHLWCVPVNVSGFSVFPSLTVAPATYNQLYEY